MTAAHPPIPVSIPASLAFLAPFAADDMIRVGAEFDGGYVLPGSLIPRIDFLVSLGVSTNWSFDEHLARLRPGIGIHAYDHTVSKGVLRRQALVGLAKAMAGMVPLSEFGRRFRLIGAYDGFFRGNAHHYRQRVHNRRDLPVDVTLPEILERARGNAIFLKMDIEGSEYRVIDDILAHADRIVGLAIEFHATDPLRAVFLEAVRKLQTRFDLVHLHANNYDSAAADGLPEVLELTFATPPGDPARPRRTALPLPGLDAPNDPGRPDYAISFGR